MPYYDYTNEFEEIITNTETIIEHQETMIENQNNINKTNTLIAIIITTFFIAEYIYQLLGGRK